MSKSPSPPCADGIPLPIVKLNRAVLVVGVTVALVLNLPLITTALFLIILPAALFGRRASLIYKVGRRLLARQIPTAGVEDFHVQRFNNLIAAALLGGAQIAFAFGASTVGWILSAAVAVAAFIALLGFCFGCFLYYQFRLQRYRFFAADKP
jgi:hypothetical protein